MVHEVRASQLACPVSGTVHVQTTTMTGKRLRCDKWSLTTGRAGLKKLSSFRSRAGLKKLSSFRSKVSQWIWTLDFNSQQYGTPS